MSLDKVGVNSLLAVNNWIGVINGNLNSASRTGYKTTRANFADGYGGVGLDRLNIPATTLSVSSTRVEWGQGSVINSDQNSHFALQGEGFFVLHDPLSEDFFLSRDGEFHWDHNGYLVNSSGLRVVSQGQDYIRYGETDESDIFSPIGHSNDFATYGDKSIMIVDVDNREGLSFSRYGSTVFKMPGDVNLRVENNFRTTTDGISFIYDDPAFTPIVDNPGFVSPAEALALGIDSDFQIDFGTNGVFDYSTVTGGDFNYLTDTIDDVVAALVAYAGGLGNVGGVPRLSVVFDTGSDRLIIENTVAPNETNNVDWLGTNGGALAQFFKIKSNGGIQELETPTYKTQIITSNDDIDNDDEAPFKDIGQPTLVGPPTYGPISTADTFAEMINIRADAAATAALPTLTYTHNKQTSTVRSDTFLGPLVAAGTNVPLYGSPSGSAMVISEANQTDEFEVVFDAKVTTNGRMVFAFGKENPHELYSGGFSLVYNPGTGAVGLFQDPDGYLLDAFPVQVGVLQNVGAFGVAPSAGALAGGFNRMVAKLSSDQVFTFSVNGNVATYDLGGSGNEISGSMSLRTHYLTGAAPGPADPPMSLELNNIYVDVKERINTGVAGNIQSLSQLSLDYIDRNNYGRQTTRVVQNALESSTASLTEYVPMLALAQKVFSAVSKIISTYNQTVDDMNSLIR